MDQKGYQKPFDRSMDISEGQCQGTQYLSFGSKEGFLLPKYSVNNSDFTITSIQVTSYPREDSMSRELVMATVKSDHIVKPLNNQIH